MWMLAPALFLTPYLSFGQGPKTELLWPQGAPGAVGQEDADKPALTWYRPANPNGAAVLVCPGGGYGALARRTGSFAGAFTSRLHSS